MSKIRKQLDNELSHINANVDTANDELKKILTANMSEQVYVSHNYAPLKAACAAMALITITAGGIVISNQSKTVKNVATSTHTQAPNAETQVEVVTEEETPIYTTPITIGDYDVVWGDYYFTDHTLCVELTVSSKDGSPLSTPFADSVYDYYYHDGGLFDNINVSHDGKTINYSKATSLIHEIEFKDGQLKGKNCTCSFVDSFEETDGSSSVRLELKYTNYNEDISNKDITFTLNNLNLTHRVFSELSGAKTFDQYAIGDAISSKYPNVTIKSISTNSPSLLEGVTNTEIVLDGSNFYELDKLMSSCVVYDPINRSWSSWGEAKLDRDSSEPQMTLTFDNRNHFAFENLRFMELTEDDADKALTSMYTINTAGTVSKIIKDVNVDYRSVNFTDITIDSLGFILNGKINEGITYDDFTGEFCTMIDSYIGFGPMPSLDMNMEVTLKDGTVLKAYPNESYTPVKKSDNYTLNSESYNLWYQFFDGQAPINIDVHEIKSITRQGKVFYSAE